MAVSESIPSVESAGGAADPALLISSDGHAIADMEDYRPYLPSRMHEDFDAFCVVYREHGGRNSDPKQLAAQLDPDIVQKWTREVDKRGGFGKPAEQANTAAVVEGFDKDLATAQPEYAR